MKFTSHNNDLEKNEALPRDNEARYRRVIQDQTELICRFRPDFTLTFINEAYCRYFAKLEQALLGANFLTLIPEEAHKDVLEHFATFTPEHNVSTQEHLVIKPDGEEAWQQWTNRAFFDEKGKVIEFQAVGRDITERKQAEETLRSAHEELERRVQERTVELAEANAELRKEITERKLAEEKTRDLLKQNRSLTQRLFDIQEQERQHLARDLHDEFGQWLTAIQLHAKDIRNIEPDPLSKIHENANIIEESATQMHEQLHGMIGQLRPSTLDELGLEDSLREIISQWQESHPDVVCDLSLDGNLDSLGETLNITLYRLVQEGLTNVAKHAEATRVSIHLQRDQDDGVSSDMLRLNIDDNGKGTNLTLPNEGFGLAGMRERSLAAGGDFLINSAVGKGMHIEVTLPVRLNEND